ncbi:MAG: Hint domain-containing protein [Paracoccaceae bacterium]
MVKYTLIDQNNDNDFDRFNNDSVNGSDIRQSYPGDTVTVNVPGVGNVTYTGITFYLASGQVVFTPNDGQALEDGTFVTSTFVNSQGPLLVSQLGPPCFAAGTRIATVRGEVAVEDLRVGDVVQTMDSGLRPIRWIGRRAMRGTGDFAPIRFKAGAVGNVRDLVVSPMHRVLVRGWRAELYFGDTEVLVPAKHLVDGDQVVIDPVAEVEYFHILFDQHEVIFSDGAPTESFYPGEQILRGDAEVRQELEALFPELFSGGGGGGGSFAQTARKTVKFRDAAVLRAA